MHAAHEDTNGIQMRCTWCLRYFVIPWNFRCLFCFGLFGSVFLCKVKNSRSATSSFVSVVPRTDLLHIIWHIISIFLLSTSPAQNHGTDEVAKFHGQL